LLLPLCVTVTAETNMYKYDSYYFKFSNDARDWLSAHKYCKTQGGTLASVHDASDNDRVYNACWTARCWIGLNDRSKEGNWVWSDNTQVGDYHQWAAHEPDNTKWTNGDEDCGYLHGMGYTDPAKHKQWGDHPCKEHMSFVCKIPVNYRQLTEPTDWATAEQKCREQKGHLADIQSAGDNGNVFGACKAARCWIGLNDRAAEGTFQWTDGTSLDEVAYKHWADGEPSNTVYSPGEWGGELDEDCCYIHGYKYRDENKQGMWGDHPCTQKLSAVCEVPAQFTFEVSETQEDWTTASSKCKALGGNLAHLQSFGENGRATEACTYERCWHGLNDRYREGDWQFTDGTALGSGFTNWVPGEPDDTKYANNIDEDCAYLHGTKYATKSKLGQWGDHPCNQKMNYVCQLPIKQGDAAVAVNDEYMSAPQYGEATTSGGTSFWSKFFWFLFTCALLAGVVHLAVQQGYLKEQQLHAAKRATIDGASWVAGTAYSLVAGKATASDGEYALMSNDDDAAEDNVAGLPKAAGGGDFRDSL